jgi:hypothetical protein
MLANCKITGSRIQQMDVIRSGLSFEIHNSVILVTDITISFQENSAHAE